MNNKAVLAAAILGTLAYGQSVAAPQADETVIVHAARVAKDMKDISQSMDYLSAEDIEKHRYKTVADAIKSIANIVLPELPGDYSYIQVRGLPRHLEQSNVPIYVDGVPQTSLYGLNLLLKDVESIEFLRGPQGNTYGSNARDGIIVITTKKQGNDPSASFELGVANYDQQSGTVTAGTALIEDVLTAKVTLDYLSRDGFVENTHLNKSVDPKEQRSAMLSLHWTPSSDWTANLYLDHTTLESGVYPYVKDDPKTERGDDLKTATDIEGLFDQTSKGAALNVTWTGLENWQLSSVTGIREIDTYGRFDADLVVTPPAGSAYLDNYIREKDTFQELRLNSNLGALPVDWTFGAAFYRSHEDNNNFTEMDLNKMQLTKTAGKYTRDTYTAYMDASWRFAPTWTLKAGARYTKEDFQIDSQFYSMFRFPFETQGSYEKDYSEFLPNFAISKDFGKNHTVYASYGEGMLSGGGSWIAEASDSSGNLGHGLPYDPETSEVYELGYKSYWNDRTIIADINVFDMRVNNLQYAYQDPTTGANAIAPIKEVRSRGIEGSISALINDVWEAALSFGFNDAKVTQVDGYTGASYSEGARIPFAPEHTVNVEATYYGEIGDNWTFTPNLGVGFYGEMALDKQGNNFQDPYFVVDANVRFNYRDDFEIRLWGVNITDERYKTYSVNWGGTGFSNYGDPVRFGVDLSANF
ncbi:TonB-dependent receptor [Vibrio sp. LaRot3]|uniref:TonB-dependent receptor n=1 Tax=Vibrio sp. LaRot3 TaxID=2998829 RepID=UPI0022CE28A8|nr:TonB-dependent receptor [Vibrio sp. LaRot3]MDA0150468.1 TonB-dependent receptor [Vibrio sp. LaRot3]